jgi:xenotropic and polytropic retrovirus receptor 1
VRFAWIGFLPYPSSHFVATTRSFVFAILEVVRRVGWNLREPSHCLVSLSSHLFSWTHLVLVRLENEHIGNMDQYRVTREAPLPYNFQDDDENDVGSESDGRSERSTTITGKRTGLRTKTSVRLPTVDNSGQV